MSKVESKPSITVDEPKPIKIEFVGAIEVKDGTGSINVEKGNFYESCPIPEKTVKKYLTYVKEYDKAVATATVELAKKEFAKDGKLTNIKVTSNIGAYNDKIITNVQKNKDYPAIGDRKAFSQPYIRQTVKSSSIVQKSHLKNLVKDLAESL